MLFPVLAVLGASPCDSALPAPKIPLASEFQCPSGASAEAKGAGIECVGRAGKRELLMTTKKGEVNQVQPIEDTLHDPPVSDCIVARINDWKYRPANEEVDVAYPFVFKEHP